jgi:hypothetical protein
MINLIQISNPLVLAASLSIIPITILHRARNRSFAFFTFCTEELARLPCSIPRRRREPNAAEPTGEPPREILEPRLPLTLLLQFGQDLATGTISATRILSRRRRVRISTMRGSSIRGIVLFPSARAASKLAHALPFSQDPSSTSSATGTSSATELPSPPVGGSTLRGFFFLSSARAAPHFPPAPTPVQELHRSLPHRSDPLHRWEHAVLR